MPFNPFSALTSKIFGSLLALSLITLGPALLITRARLADANETIAALELWQDNVVVSVRLAADAPTTAGTAVAQITALGNARRDLTAAAAAQNAAVEAMRAESEAARAVAARARKERVAAVKRTEALAAEMRARPPADDTDAAVRRSQDDLYEAEL